jgi:hypothetical protein
MVIEKIWASGPKKYVKVHGVNCNYTNAYVPNCILLRWDKGMTDAKGQILVSKAKTTKIPMPFWRPRNTPISKKKNTILKFWQETIQYELQGMQKKHWAYYYI